MPAYSPRLLVVLLLAFLFPAGHAFAQTDTRGGKVIVDNGGAKGETYAIIVGLSKYAHVDTLHYADKDAQAFDDYLKGDAGGKVPAANIELFLNQNATRTNVGDAISEMARKVKPGDRLYFYFAGHGDMEDLTQIENGLLLLYNSPNGNYFGMNDDVLEILDLKRYLSPLATRGIDMIFIVDACHAGNLKGGVEGAAQTATALQIGWGQEVKILSCQPKQLSEESEAWGGGRGLFSYELEEAMKGMADLNNDGVISLYEIQAYIQANVAKYSEGKQIPLVTGDLTKVLATINPAVLTALKKEKEKNYPMLAVAKMKGDEGIYLDSLDKKGKELYIEFNTLMERRILIRTASDPRTSALSVYYHFKSRYEDNPLVSSMRRRLAVALNDRFNAIVAPLLKGKTSYSSRNECYYAGVELDSCRELLGREHYMYNNIWARELYMYAMSLTWALAERENKVSMLSDVQLSIRLLEKSLELEPNASYTLEGLGENYSFILEYEKADAAFAKYLELRPNDYYAKYSLGLIYKKLKEYDKAEAIFEHLLKEDTNARRQSIKVDLYSWLAEIYFFDGNRDKSLAYTRMILDSCDDKNFANAEVGEYYTMASNIDSAIYYYKESAKYKGSVAMNHNNLGYLYVLNGQPDSARKYLKMAIAEDIRDGRPTPHPYFNLATLEFNRANYQAAIDYFQLSVDKALLTEELFIQQFQKYLGKSYHVMDNGLYREFRMKVFPFNVRYISYVCMIYSYIRDPAWASKGADIDSVFTILREFKQFQELTSYHYACYLALKKDTIGALSYLNHAMEQGFGDYFMLTSDADLDAIRSMPEFLALLRKYFPKYPVTR